MRNLLRSECIKCMAEKNMNRMPEGVTEEQKLAYLQGILGIISKAPVDVCAPVIVRDIDLLSKEIFGTAQDYSKEKTYYNQLMLEKEAGIREKIHASEDVLLTALQYALVGNYIDFGAMHSVDDAYLEELLEDVRSKAVAAEAYEKLKKDLSTCKKLVFLTDNAGEAVMDKLFIEVIKEIYSPEKVTVLVKGSPVLNDAAMEDAMEIGLDKVAEVIDNGNGIAGTWLPELSDKAREIMDAADVIISKGQANFETLRLCGKNIYYIFLCKCKMFCENFKVPQYTGMLIREKDLSGSSQS